MDANTYYEKLKLELRGNVRRNVRPNTTLSEQGVALYLRLWGTNVITAYANGYVTFATGGWQTPTTKDRINHFAPKGVQVYQKDWQWKLVTPKGTFAFYDGITIDAEGNVLDRDWAYKAVAQELSTPA